MGRTLFPSCLRGHSGQHAEIRMKATFKARLMIMKFQKTYKYLNLPFQSLPPGQTISVAHSQGGGQCAGQSPSMFGMHVSGRGQPEEEKDLT